MTWFTATPNLPVTAFGDNADCFLRPEEIDAARNRGWAEVPPMWIQHKDYQGQYVVHFVDHPAHQKRLLLDGGVQVAGPDGGVKIPNAIEMEIERRVAQQIALYQLAREVPYGSTNDDGGSHIDSSDDDQRSSGIKPELHRSTDTRSTRQKS